MKQKSKRKMLVYTVGLTAAGRTWFERVACSDLAEARHFGTPEDFEAALQNELPGMVVVASPPYTVAEVRRILGANEKTEGIPVFRAPGPSHNGDGPNGSAQAVMTGFDQMPPIDDSDPWRKQPA